MTETLAQYDGPATIVLAIAIVAALRYVLTELREMRKTNTKLVELLARQDERERMTQTRRGRTTRPPDYVTLTPAHGVPTYVTPENSRPIGDD